MFTNIEELRELIRQGKTNEEIIAERISFLESNNRMTVNPVFNGSQVIFYNGFIEKNTLISADSDDLTDKTLYMADIIELYDELINIVRKNMEKKGLPLKIILQKVWEYFSKSEDSQYKELINFMKQFMPNEKYIDREFLPFIIQEYINSTYEGSITDFGKAFMYRRFGTPATKERYREEIEKMSSSVDWNKVENEPTICKLSILKGSGIAACTEKSIAMQNCLTFLGFESYLVAGSLNVDGNVEEHNFNVVRDSKGNYVIVDAAQACIIPLKDINSPEELLYLDGVVGTNGYGQQITYTSRYPKNKSSQIGKK